MRRVSTAAFAILCITAIAAAEPAARLTRAQIRNAKGELRGDATMGQNTVDYFIELQIEHAAAIPVMNEAFACRLGPTEIVKPIAHKRARRLSADLRVKLAMHDPAALESLAIDVIGELDGVEPSSIRADEALGPGVYRPAITAVAYTIGRCRFYR